MSITLIYIIISVALGISLGYIGRHYLSLIKKNSIESEINKKLFEAKKEAEKIEIQALEFQSEIKQRLEKAENRLDKREDDLDSFEESLKLEKEKLINTADNLKKIKQDLENKKIELNNELEKIAGYTEAEALEILFKKLEEEHREDLKSRLLKLSRDGEKKYENKAQEILVTAIHRLANNSLAEYTSSIVELEDDEIKGKIIGKEGRNIKTFEKVSGVELIIDEMPNAVVVSCFDPIRRAIAVNALNMLIQDGRIQPIKIEETLEKAKKELGTFIRRKGEEAVLEVGLLNIPDEIIPILGRLYFRTSYGQNVLNHSIEMAHLAGLIASELGVDVKTAKAGALLHDIGKAVDHEIEGTHVEIGRKILKKYGVNEKIILAMQAHHEEYPYETIESIIVQVADAISGSRPGARRDTVENYIKRLTELENIAMSFTGIEKVYALQAGREVRVFVEPELINDLEAIALARNIALKIETEVNYPGEIKINVIRESRIIEFAR